MMAAVAAWIAQAIRAYRFTRREEYAERAWTAIRLLQVAGHVVHTAGIDDYDDLFPVEIEIDGETYSLR